MSNLSKGLKIPAYDEIRFAVLRPHTGKLPVEAAPAASNSRNIHSLRSCLCEFEPRTTIRNSGKDLLPYRSNDRYRARSLKQKARELADLKRNRQNNFDNSATHWDEFKRLCQAVNEGQREWSVPAYNGGLFAEDQQV